MSEHTHTYQLLSTGYTLQLMGYRKYHYVRTDSFFCAGCLAIQDRVREADADEDFPPAWYTPESPSQVRMKK